MLQVFPSLSISISCRDCENEKVDVAEIKLIGIHFLADCHCPRCGLDFYHALPVGHTLLHPISVKKNVRQKFSLMKPGGWLISPLLKAIEKPNSEDLGIEIKDYFKRDEAIFLNCLDYLYGHVVLKLLNATHYINHCNDKGLIVIIPKKFEWLVPEGVAQVWLVDLPLSKTQQWFKELETLFAEEVKKYRNAFVSLAYSHPDPDTFDIEDFARVPRFDRNGLKTNKPVLTFIYREDRPWLSSWALRRLAVYSQYLKITPLNKILSLLQKYKVARFFRLLKKKLPNATFNIVGLEKKGGMPSFVHDLRVGKTYAELERIWCELYASSHLVIGIHGSNMLLPTALAGGFLEIMPSERIANFMQDVLRIGGGRDSHFHGRFIPASTSVKEVVLTAALMINKYDSFKRTMTAEYLQHGVFSDVGKWRDANLY
jgi:hypothetical protein